mmetsp:Transcript_88097/g.174838  ORF Transcript_88097/g.174838 Transcript_88097/m.174838 type:complete len:172 (-) Transcript_88097:74-589(-)|eukprot:CAMPEP_0172711922 /NCGR_PEP_ID=MMETSP1074-20121228/60703_1 /TAXON_ID=2916 /ORGANISM="Ceratium fusus, Strain PA161109" /LENGTH=171 /DNA_ID=CAMNT_0013535773 /DNA_START=54 /DNA_END=569 /DNA_ORIENTATION=-
MADAEDETFEATDAGASHTFPFQAGDLKKGSHMMIKGNPCKVAEISMSKTGKHGHAKAHIVGLDIFTGKKYEDLCPSSHNVECPFVKRTEYTFLDADHDSGEVTLLKENGDMKQDLNLPDRVLVGEATEDDKKLTTDIKSAQEAGKEMSVVVLEACGKEKIIQLKEKEGGS